jgi:predicted dehydrogenase
LRDLIHEIDYAGWIFGWPKTVQACVRNLSRLGIDTDEVAELLWETAAGCTVSVGLDYLSRPSRRRMRVAGELGMLEWDGIEGTVTLALPDVPVRVERSYQTLDGMFLEQARAFIGVSRGIYDPRLATDEDGVKALAVCDAGRRASENRREELVKYW